VVMMRKVLVSSSAVATATAESSKLLTMSSFREAQDEKRAMFAPMQKEDELLKAYREEVEESPRQRRSGRNNTNRDPDGSLSTLHDSVGAEAAEDDDPDANLIIQYLVSMGVPKGTAKKRCIQYRSMMMMWNGSMTSLTMVGDTVTGATSTTTMTTTTNGGTVNEASNTSGSSSSSETAHGIYTSTTRTTNQTGENTTIGTLGHTERTSTCQTTSSAGLTNQTPITASSSFNLDLSGPAATSQQRSSFFSWKRYFKSRLKRKRPWAHSWISKLSVVMNRSDPLISDSSRRGGDEEGDAGVGQPTPAPTAMPTTIDGAIEEAAFLDSG